MQAPAVNLNMTFAQANDALDRLLQSIRSNTVTFDLGGGTTVPTHTFGAIPKDATVRFLSDKEDNGAA